MSKIKRSKLDVSKLEVKEINAKVQIVNNEFDLVFDKGIKAIFSIDLNPLFNLEENAIKIELSINIDLESNDRIYRNIGEFSYDFIYQYDNLADLKDQQGEISPEIFLTCSNISYSTLRGIIYAKSTNTCLENVLLPIVTGGELLEGIKK